jgi:hypothetical protein
MRAWWGGVLAVGLGIGCDLGGTPTTNSSTPMPSATAARPKVGTTGSLVAFNGKPTGTVFLFGDRAGLEALRGAALANDLVGEQQAVALAVHVPDGTRALLIEDEHFHGAIRVRVIGGEHADFAGWVFADALRP